MPDRCTPFRREDWMENLGLSLTGGNLPPRPWESRTRDVRLHAIGRPDLQGGRSEQEAQRMEGDP